MLSPDNLICVELGWLVASIALPSGGFFDQELNETRRAGSAGKSIHCGLKKFPLNQIPKDPLRLRLKNRYSGSMP